MKNLVLAFMAILVVSFSFGQDKENQTSKINAEQLKFVGIEHNEMLSIIYTSQMKLKI